MYPFSKAVENGDLDAVAALPAADAASTRPARTGWSGWLLPLALCVGLFTILVSITASGTAAHRRTGHPLPSSCRLRKAMETDESTLAPMLSLGVSPANRSCDATVPESTPAPAPGPTPSAAHTPSRTGAPIKAKTPNCSRNKSDALPAWKREHNESHRQVRHVEPADACTESLGLATTAARCRRGGRHGPSPARGTSASNRTMIGARPPSMPLGRAHHFLVAFRSVARWSCTGGSQGQRAVLAAKFEAILAHLGERQRRLSTGAEAQSSTTTRSGPSPVPPASGKPLSL